jgi:ABC-type sugar transport system substrate-binding protein
MKRAKHRLSKRTTRAAGVPLTLLALAVLVAAGCGSDSGGSKSSGGGGAKSVDLGFVYATTNGNFAQEMALGAQSAAQHSPGVKFHQSAPNSADGPAQVQLFQSAIRTSKDGLALETLFPNLFVRPVTQAEKAGIPQVAVDTPPPKGTNVPTFVGNDNAALGVQLAKALAPKIPKDAKGQVLVGTDTPGLIVLELRNKGFEQALKKERPGVSFVNFDSKQDPTDNFNSWSSQVKSHPDALAYVGPGTQDAVSMAQIERKTGKHYLVGACDLDPIALKGVADGTVTALVSPEHWLKGYIALKLLADKAQKGKALPKGFWNPGDLTVDKTNVKEITARQKSNESRYQWFKKEADKQLANPQKYIQPLPG